MKCSSMDDSSHALLVTNSALNWEYRHIDKNIFQFMKNKCYKNKINGLETTSIGRRKNFGADWEKTQIQAYSRNMQQNA